MASLWKAALGGFQQRCCSGVGEKCFQPCAGKTKPIPWFPKAKETSPTTAQARSLRPFPAVELPKPMMGDSQGTLSGRRQPPDHTEAARFPAPLRTWDISKLPYAGAQAFILPGQQCREHQSPGSSGSDKMTPFNSVRSPGEFESCDLTMCLSLRATAQSCIWYLCPLIC